MSHLQAIQAGLHCSSAQGEGDVVTTILWRLYPQVAPGTHWIGCVGIRAGEEVETVNGNPLPSTGIKPRSFQSVASYPTI